MLGVPSVLWSETLKHFRHCGGGRRECVAYWTGPAIDPMVVDAVVHPRHAATIGSYELNERWLHGFWIDLARRRRSVRVQVHTHASEAFHSRTDDLWPIVHVPGFLSLVIPNFAMNFTIEQLYLTEINVAGEWEPVDVWKTLGGLS